MEETNQKAAPTKQTDCGMCEPQKENPDARVRMMLESPAETFLRRLKENLKTSQDEVVRVTRLIELIEGNDAVKEFVGVLSPNIVRMRP